jgi:large subunit ribosomal protein L15
MITLSSLKNTTRPKKKIQRVGRGIGSGRGKTCCRGVKGDKARSGYKRRYGNEGGQMPLYKKLPIRGFSNTRFKNSVRGINLSLIDRLYKDGETVNKETLIEKGILNRRSARAFKILGGGKLQKKVKFDVTLLSEAVREDLSKRSLLV